MCLGDITDECAFEKLVFDIKPTSIIHLAGLQIPTCRAAPIRGAHVNIIGTLSVFEAVKSLMVLCCHNDVLLSFCCSLVLFRAHYA